MKRLFALLLIAASAYAGAADTEDADVSAVFDRNKGSVYSVYSRALRDNPKLSGKVVFDFDIAKTGEVSDCRVQSSDMGSPEFARKLCDRVRQMKFAPRAAPFTATKTLRFHTAM